LEQSRAYSYRRKETLVTCSMELGAKLSAGGRFITGRSKS
jgi:hypothetical protein